MDFNLSEPVRDRSREISDAFTNAFPLTTRLETRFRDDSEKLHSDLVGVSLDLGATPTCQEVEDEVEKGAGQFSIEEDEGLFSLPVTWSNIKTKKAISKVRRNGKEKLHYGTEIESLVCEDLTLPFRGAQKRNKSWALLMPW